MICGFLFEKRQDAMVENLNRELHLRRGRKVILITIFLFIYYYYVSHETHTREETN